MSIFCVLMGEYVWRRLNERPFHKLVYSDGADRMPMDRHMKMLLAGITISTVLIYIRYALPPFGETNDDHAHLITA